MKKKFFQVPLSESIKEVKYTGADGVEYTGIQFEGWASTEDKDRGGDRVLAGAFTKTLQEYMENPVVFLQHDSDKPIGNITEAEVEDGKGLYVKGIVKVDTDDIFKKLRCGVVKAMSIGYRVKDYNIEEITVNGNTDTTLVIKELDLFEISLVSVPMNPKAQLKENMTDDEYKSLFKLDSNVGDYVFTKSIVDLATELKAVPKFNKNEKLAPEQKEWDGRKARLNMKRWSTDSQGNVDFGKYERAFAWYDEENENNLGAYKLPFKDIIGGELTVVWNGLKAAMGALLGARGGTNIPAEEKIQVYQLLKNYYKLFDKEVPEQKDYNIEELKEMGYNIDEIDTEEGEIEETFEEKAGGMTLHTLIFDKEVFTREEAIKWASDHDYKTSNVRETTNTYRIRQIDPTKFDQSTFRTIDITKGVQAVVGILKSGKAEDEVEEKEEVVEEKEIIENEEVVESEEEKACKKRKKKEIEEEVEEEDEEEKEEEHVDSPKAEDKQDDAGKTAIDEVVKSFETQIQGLQESIKSQIVEKMPTDYISNEIFASEKSLLNDKIGSLDQSVKSLIETKEELTKQVKTLEEQSIELKAQTKELEDLTAELFGTINELMKKLKSTVFDSAMYYQTGKPTSKSDLAKKLEQARDNI